MDKDYMEMLKIALAMSNTEVNPHILMRVIATHEILRKKGDKFSLKDAAFIETLKLPE